MHTQMLSPSNKNSKLSIITINRNNAEGLKKTIESIVNQSYTNFEYIIIDGASTDHSVEIIKEYEYRLNYWISESDKGIYNAMNKGIKQASGEYCLFLNSGDFLIENNVIENVIKRGLQSDIYSYGCQITKENFSIIHLPPKEITLFTFTCGSLPHPSSFIKRSLLIEMNGYDENYRIASDYKFFFEILIIKNASYTSSDYVTSVFEGLSGISSISDNNSCLRKIEEQKIHQMLQDYFPRIIPDYFLKEHVKFEYFYNTFLYLSENKVAMKIVFPLIHVIHHLIHGRNSNYRLNRIYHSLKLK